MRGERRILAALALGLSLASPAFADGLTASVGGSAPAVPARANEITSEVGDLRDAVSSIFATDEKVNHKAYQLFSEGVPHSKVIVKVNLRGWDTEKEITGTPADENRLVTSAQRRLSELKAVPPPEFSDANAYALKMNGTEKLAFSDNMEENHMGVYRYSAKSALLGNISLSQILRLIAAKVGDVFAFATVIHESAHARDHQQGKLNPESVIDGEILAFQTQYLWLKMIDPYGERLGMIRILLADEMRTSPSKVTAAALSYATALHVLEGTGGDYEKIREYVKQLGYTEGHSHSEDERSHPSA